ncbi:MAG: glycoside hydrolase [Acidobacteriota bacterium]
MRGFEKLARGLFQTLALSCCLFITSAVGAGGFPADQPFASFWFPNELLTWDPATDPDAPFNRSAVPLQTRFLNPALQVNSHARPGEARVSALSIMNPSTSNNPSQGSLVFDRFTFNYWQYVDLLVFWGGSAGEGLILAPNPGVIDAGHRNGVEVLGTVFFPPIAFGGELNWVEDMVQRSGSTFPVADKLIEVAEYYGFDGWFINQETNGGDAQLATDIRDFIRYVHDNSSLHIMWYDSMIESGPIIWQNELNTVNDAFVQENGGRVSDSMFLNFFWSTLRLANSRTHAIGLGRSPFDVYAGIDVQANGFNTPVNWPALFPEGSNHVVSLGFFGTNWTFTESSSREQFYQRANRFWIGANRDPADTTTAEPWIGVAHYVPAYSPIDSIPFVTHFNTGQGNLYAVDGEVLRVGDWNNRALQDVLPTWRWRLDSSGSELLPELVWDDAYDGGTSLKVSGTLDATNQLDLFATKVPIAGDSVLQIAYKTGSAGTASNLQVGLTFEDGIGLGPLQLLDVGNTASEGWNVEQFDLGAFSGQTLAKLSLVFEEAATEGNTYSINIGKLALIAGPADVPQPPSNLVIVNRVEPDPRSATLRLTWDHSPDPVHAYNVYRRNPDDSRTYLGGTPSNAYFVAELNRVGVEVETTIEVEAVGVEGERSITAATASFLWNEMGLIFADSFESGDTSSW